MALKFVAPSLLLVFAVAIILFLRAERPASGQQPAQISKDIQPAAISGNIQKTAINQFPHPTSSPLPPADTPLATVFSDLQSRARSGDAAAAMRLFKDLSRCNARRYHIQQINRLSLSKDSTEIARPDIVAKDLNDLDASDGLCKDVSAAAIDNRGEQLRQAAQDGDPEAMVCYSMSTVDSAPPYLSDSWFQYTQRWINEAPAFAQQAFAMGQADVIPVLIDAYAPPVPETMKNYDLAQVVEPDAAMAYGLALLYKQVAPASAMQSADNILEDLGKNVTEDQKRWANEFANSNIAKFENNASRSSAAAPCFGAY